MTVIVFPSRQVADTALKEIAATPDLDGGVGPVWVWHDPDGDVNQVQYAVAADGRVAIAHPWSALDREWLSAYLAAWSGVELRDDLPADWQAPDA